MIGFYCAGNWKMNKNLAQAAEFVKQLRAEAPADAHSSLVLLPSAILAGTVAAGLKGTTINWGGQNCYFEPKGAFTGETSPQVLQELGAKYCLVGHSERRQIFGEPEEMLAKKVRACQDNGLTPILCVGETLDDRRWNRTQEVIVRQLKTGLHLADAIKPLWLAYEPVWAIGTGQVATPDQVEEAHVILRKGLHDWNAKAAETTPILYGGSAKPDNVRTLAVLKNVNGFLIGGASLEVSEFLKIYSISKEARG
jgi:triosephosphate isomerase (TIM)